MLGYIYTPNVYARGYFIKNIGSEVVDDKSNTQHISLCITASAVYTKHCRWTFMHKESLYEGNQNAFRKKEKKTT